MTGPLRNRLTVQAQALAVCEAHKVRAGKRMVDAAMDAAVNGVKPHGCKMAALKAAKEECGSIAGLLAWMAFQLLVWPLIKRWIDSLLQEPVGQAHDFNE